MLRRKRKASLAESAALPLLVGGATIAVAELGRRFYRETQLFSPAPDPVISWDPRDYGVPEGAAEEVWIETPDGELLYGWYCRAEKPVASGVFCHGNTGNLTISADVIPHLLNAGFNVLFFDYRGFGKSSGKASFRGVISDGITAARFHDQIRPQHLPSILYGYSLGGAVAAQVIRRHRFDALILQSTFTTLPDVTKVLYPKLPLHLFAGSEFHTVEVIKSLRVPLLILHGTEDETCPAWMAEKIFGACTSPKSMHRVDGGMHKDLFIKDPDALIWAISQFIADLPSHGHIESSVEETPALEKWSDSALRAVRRWLRRKTHVAAS